MKKLILFTLILAMLLCGCGSENQEGSSKAESNSSAESQTSSNESSQENSDSQISTDESQDMSEDTSSDTSDDEEEHPPVHIPDQNENPLTGLMDITDAGAGKRPVAIMVNNIRASLPQYGIDKADILFEMPAEGGISRFMAMYADQTQIPRVCSIRSCRKYFPAVSEGFDAIYVNCGRNKVINSYLATLNLTHYDGAYDTRLFARDQDRLDAGYGTEHTVYFDGPRLPEILKDDNARTEIEDDKKGTAFNFNPLGQEIAPNGIDCDYVHVSFGSNKSGFTYDAETNTYLKDFRGTPQVEGTTGEQLAFTNVIILETEVGNDPNGMHKTVDWHGGEDSIGYYISNGKMQKIHWSKENEQSPLKFFDENGNDLSINRGKSYIAFTWYNYTSFEK